MKNNLCHNRNDFQKIRDTKLKELYRKEMEILNELSDTFTDLHYWIECKSNKEYDILICNKFNNLATITIYKKPLEKQNNQSIYFNISFSNQGRCQENGSVLELSTFRDEDINEFFKLVSVVAGMDSNCKCRHTKNTKTINISYKSDNRDCWVAIKKLQKYLIERILEKECNGMYYENGYRLDDEFENAVLRARLGTAEDRKSRLNVSKKTPEIKKETHSVFKRNPDVVAEVLERANGICERCGQNAPFIKVSDGKPYLEVHHKIRLADEGEDTVENAIGVCPNCHRELHYGIN